MHSTLQYVMLELSPALTYYFGGKYLLITYSVRTPATIPAAKLETHVLCDEENFKEDFTWRP